MASTSASSIKKSFKYDVFLSFRGEDTRKNFVDHLYQALEQKSIDTYKDDEKIKKGKRISDELLRSIEDSRFYIIVFSKNYASSSWCLDELTKIMECQKVNGHTAYPIFYNVEPTEVRNQSGAVGEAFAKHKEEESALKWRQALMEAADLAGWELKYTLDGHEAKFIQKIVQEISLELRLTNMRVDGKLVGMEKRVNDVLSALGTDIDDFRMIGIKGIGGGGKTTLARVVFDQLSAMFDGSSFVENVREISKGMFGGLKSLQKQVLIDVLNDPHINVNGVADLKNMMRKRMCGRKVLAVLDDVDHIDQLEALAGEPNWFKPGSRVIVTTRDEQVLVAHGVPKNLILDVNLLSAEEAKCLFNRYAFGGENPNHGYEMLSGEVVHYAAGLPLTIRVLGSFLRGKDEQEWTDELKRLKTIPLTETLQILELSYNSLEEYQKEIFLDVACILKGWGKERAIRVLESCGFHARIGLKVLEQKSLITVSDSGWLSMHDHLEEMGKNIVRRLHPDEPCKHSRLWIDEEIKDILEENKGTDETRCMKVNLDDLVSAMKGLRSMKKLRFLSVIGNDVDEDRDYNDVVEDQQYLPDGLRYLVWHRYPYKCSPKHFKANNLVGLEMHFSNVDQLWKGEENKVLKKLRFIDLHSCKLRTLDVWLFPNLERLKLEWCVDLAELRMPVENFMLKYLNLIGSKLSTLDLAHAKNLDAIKVEWCSDLEEIHMPVDNLKLKHISLRCSKLKTLNLTGTPNIEMLVLVCEDLVELHMPAESFKLKSFELSDSKLRILDIGWAENLESFDIHFNDYLVELDLAAKKLKSLRLRCSKLKTLNLTGTPNIEMLDLVCEDLVELHMPAESFKLKSFELSDSKLRILDIGWAENLESFDIHFNDYLVELDLAAKKLKSLRLRCSKLKTLNLTGTPNIEMLDLVCEDLVELDLATKKLKSLILRCSKLKTLNLTGTPNIEMLDLVCGELVELHMADETPVLKDIYIRHSKLRSLDIAQARNLEKLALALCMDMIELRMPHEGLELNCIHISCSNFRTLDFTQAQKLEKLYLLECGNLQEVHMPIESPELKIISIHCVKLRTLNLKGTWNLEVLNVNQCEDLVEVHMPIESPKLKTINIHCSKLRALHLGQGLCLESIDLNGCFNLEEIHAPVGCLSGSVWFKPLLVNQEFPVVGSSVELHLIVRSLGMCPLHPDNNLPKFYFECIYKELPPPSTQNLKTLISFGSCACSNLANLSVIMYGLHCLRKLTLEGSLREVPKDLDRLECLEELSLLSTEIERLPDAICMLKHLKFLQIKSCWNLKNLPGDLGRLECLEELHLTDCTSLRDIPNSIREMKHLKYFHLTDCANLAGLSESICGLQSLRKLTLEGSIPEVPKELDRLELLEELSLLSTKIEHLPDSICMLKHLKSLKLKACWFLKQLPAGLGRLECLEELHLTDCTSLRDIPNSICAMKSLKSFHLTNCILVVKLPKEIGRLKCLKELNIKGTYITDLPQSIFELEDLVFVL